MQPDVPPIMKQTQLAEDEKKLSVKQQVEVLVPPCSSSEEESTSESDDIDEKRLIRRMDLVLIPWLSLLYLLCFLDRVGIGNARLYRMENDLSISDTEYLVALSLFFVPYSLLEMPSNLALKRLRPSVWLSTIMLLWGIATTCLGFVENFDGLISLRVLLGIFEAGFSPGVFYYLSCWYKRNEVGFRMALFMSSVSFAGAFGGLLAAAISNMNGVGGKGAWAWIFIIEGLVTVVASVASFFIVQDFPDSARFLSERERAFVIRRLQGDDQFSAGGEKLEWKNVKKSLVDYKTWLGAMSLIGFGGPLYSFVLFLPSIITELGYTATRANLLTVPIYFAASVFACVVGYIADRLQRRGYITICLTIITGASYIVLSCSRQPALSYFATYIAAFGIFPGSPNVMFVSRAFTSLLLQTNDIFSAWVSNNVEGSYKRGITIAFMITYVTLIGGVVSSNTYRQSDTPWYTLGNTITLGYIVTGFIGTVTMHILLRRENARRDRGERNEVIGDSKDGDPHNGVYESIEEAKRDKGDNWSGYRYIT